MRIAFAAGLALLASCKDSSGPTGLSGTVSFNYSGTTSGSFSATGGVPLSGQTETVEWAAGYRSDADAMVLVVAKRPRSSTTHDWIYIQAPRLTAGASTIDENCTANNCAAVLVDLNVNNTSGNSDFFCGLTTGTITITSISSTRMEGTFNGAGDCFTATGTGSFTIANGTFNVALVSDVPGL